MSKYLSVPVFLAFVGMYLYYFQQADEVHANVKYTIGYTSGTHWTLKSGRQVDYRFVVDGLAYAGGDDKVPDTKRENGRYLLKYDSRNPKWNAVYFLRCPFRIALPKCQLVAGQFRHLWYRQKF